MNITEENFTRINNDINGNPRYAIHFLNCQPFEGASYEQTVKAMNKIGGRKYHNKSYGGGIVFQSYNLKEDIKLIEGIKSHE